MADAVVSNLIVITVLQILPINFTLEVIVSNFCQCRTGRLTKWFHFHAVRFERVSPADLDLKLSLPSTLRVAVIFAFALIASVMANELLPL